MHCVPHRFARILAVVPARQSQAPRRRRQRLSDLILLATAAAMSCALLATFLLSLSR